MQLSVKLILKCLNQNGKWPLNFDFRYCYCIWCYILFFGIVVYIDGCTIKTPYLDFYYATCFASFIVEINMKTELINIFFIF